MKYLLMIYDDEAAWAAKSPQELQDVMGEYYAFGDSIRGIMLGGEALQPTPTAKTVKVRDGQSLITDGPYAETKEQLGGFYLVECETEEEAVEAASRIPSAKWGSVEVRACQVFPEAPEHPA